jgi:hypothetical protein
MLINLRSEQLQQEFGNNTLMHRDRLRFQFSADAWQGPVAGADQFRSLLSDILNDWGTGLSLSLYEEAIVHFCGGDAVSIRPSAVFLNGNNLGLQNMRFVTGGTAFKMTAFENPKSRDQFARHAQCLVNHADIEALLWANIGRHTVTLRTLTPER